MTFARGLRAILRQHPDVVMVGEPGHGDHGNRHPDLPDRPSGALHPAHQYRSASSPVCAMGIEPFLLASSLVGVMAQWLVRVLCPHCKTPFEAGAIDMKHMGLDPATATAPTLCQAIGCNVCNRPGYRGRTGIYEVIEVDNTLRHMVHDGKGEQAMKRYVRKQISSIHADGLRRVLAGETSLEEVLRVTQED